MRAGYDFDALSCYDFGVKLISSRESVSFLSQAAPRVWVQRMLKCMIVDGEIDVYFSAGRIQPHTLAFHLTIPLREQAGEFTGLKMDAAIKEHFEPDLAAKLIGKEGMDRIDDEPIEWQSEDGHEVIDHGWIVFADEINWDAGTISVSWVPTDRNTADWMFPSGEFFVSDFDSADYEAEFQGMSFKLSAIEMLLPNSSVPADVNSHEKMITGRSRVGRPAKWDWEGALAHVVMQAQTPDGLPVGPGAQAQLEKMISEWFVEETGDTPAPSQIRERAAKIMRSLEMPKTPKIL